MPVIDEVTVGSGGSVIISEQADVAVGVELKFSQAELELGLHYFLYIALFEIDETIDVHTSFLNGGSWYYQRSPRGGRDDYAGARAIRFKPQGVSHTESASIGFAPIIGGERESTLELRALVQCVPETGPVQAWSATEGLHVAFAT